MQLDPSAFLADPELIEALDQRATRFTCDEDRVLFRQGDQPVGLFIIHNGEASLSMNPGTSEKVFSCQSTAGSLLGVPGLIGNQPYSLTAVANRGAEISFIAREDFNALIQSEQPLMLMVLQVLAAEVRSARLALTQL
ncbi:MAG: cyclic nucleotide-binding domain-containing protein [Terracidiphilus sp.]